MKNIFNILSLLLCFVASTSTGTTLRLSDAVGTVIPYASIYNTNTGDGTISNEEGIFNIVGDSSDTIEISCLGYVSYSADLEKIYSDSVIILEKSAIILDECQVDFVDVVSLVDKSKSKIKKNYPKKEVKISGVYKEFSKIDLTYYGFVKADIDVYFESMTSRSFSEIKTQVNTYKTYKHKDYQIPLNIRVDDQIRSLLIRNYLYLLNTNRYQYEYGGYLLYGDSKLLKVSFESKEINTLHSHSKGYFYIDNKTYAIVFIKIIRKNSKYYNCGGVFQKEIMSSVEILFECSNELYYPARMVKSYTISLAVPDQQVNPQSTDGGDTIEVDGRFDFFTRDLEYKPKKYTYIKENSLDSIYKNGGTQDLEEKVNYNNDFLIDLDEEMLLDTQTN